MYSLESIVCQFFFSDVVFSTAHRSKGLEFDTVIVADDFRANFTTRVGPQLNFGEYLILNEENENCK